MNSPEYRGAELADAHMVRGRRRDQRPPLHFGLGYELPDPIGTYGPAEVAFGHSGAGGGRHGAWPTSGVGFSFTTNELRGEDVDDRASSLLATLASAL